MDTFRLELIRAEAAKRLHDAAVLEESSASGQQSDSSYLLKLLGLELLLKCIVEAHTGTAPWGHKYEEIFGKLPHEVQACVAALARDRIGPSALDAGCSTVLRELGSNFVDLRYPYSRYSGLSREQYEALGERWFREGANLEAAEFRYYPEELFGLLHALQVACSESMNQCAAP